MASSSSSSKSTELVSINVKPTTSSADETAHVAAERRYIELTEKLHSQWKDCPDVFISYENLTNTISIPVVERHTPNIVSSVFHGLKRLVVKRKMKEFHALYQCQGLIKPASMTLVLAPPGHGKSTLLKILSNRMKLGKSVTGSLRYNGLTPQEALAKGVKLDRLFSYVGQKDVHFPTLTVKETFQFAADNCIADIGLLGSSELSELETRRVEMLISLLGLDECANTIVGDALLRGVSGGQKRRTSLGEKLLTNARGLFLDEVSTGLDAAVTFHIFEALLKWCRTSRGCVVTALLQPTPETYDLFDDIILLREGRIVYHGPRTGVKDFMQNVVGVPVPDGADEAGFLVDFLTDPVHIVAQAERRQGIFAPRRVSTSAAVSPMADSALFSPAPASAPASAPAPAPAPAPSVPLPSSLDTPPISPREMLHRDSLVAPAPPTPISFSMAAAAAFANAPNSRPNSASVYRLGALPKVTTDELVESFSSTATFKHMKKEIDELASSAQAVKAQFETSKWSPFTKAQYHDSHPHSFFQHFALNLGRQRRLVARNKTMIRPRIFQSIFNGVIYGTLFLNLGFDDFINKLGLLLFVVMNAAFSNLAELPVADEARNVVTKQLDSSFYPTMSYLMSVVLLHAPLVVIEAFIFGSFMYWLPGFRPEASRYFFFVFLYWCMSMGLSTFFRCISYSAKNPDVARQMDFPFLLIFIVFGGFLIAFEKIPIWLQWIYFLDPLSWGVRSLSLNEFKSTAYDQLVPSYSNGAIVTVRKGDAYMMAFGLDTTPEYQWGGIGFLLGNFLVYWFLSAYLLSYVRPPAQLGTKRTVAQHHAPNQKPGEVKAIKAADGSVAVSIPVTKPDVVDEVDDVVSESDSDVEEATMSRSSSAALAVAVKLPGQSLPVPAPVRKISARKSSMSEYQSALPFKPVTLAWTDICYFVEIPVVNMTHAESAQQDKDAHADSRKGKKKKTFWRQLLRNINGFSKPGTLTALMGSSGAGKTTLMDLIAGRKTMGRIEGKIFVDGHEIDTRQEEFARMMGYVEQQDLHIGTATVREALHLSARLRLPSSVDETTRIAFVNEVIELVGLTNVADRLIGDEAIPGLSPGQLKLVTIAVELVANPSILFLDEPTSGLDAPSAARVMKAIRRIADTGRSVLCTIHQPSEDIFFAFDRMLLLKSGGYEVFFGDLGRDAIHLVDYLETCSNGCPSIPQLEVGVNPANWMLDVIGCQLPVKHAQDWIKKASSAPYYDFSTIWKACALRQKELEETIKVTKMTVNKAVNQRVVTYPSSFVRYYHIQKRYFISHWRNAPMNLTRFALLLICAILFGCIYYKVDATDFAGSQSLLSVIFLAMSFPSAMASGGPQPTFFRERAVYYRERSARMYGFPIYGVCTFVVELPYLFISIMVFVLPFYFMVGLKQDIVYFFKFFLVVFLMSQVYASLNMLWLALMPNAIVANIVNGLFMGLFFIFGGMFIKPSAIAPGWKWFYYIDPVPKALLAAALTQFECSGTACPKILIPGSPVAIDRYQYMASLLDGTVDQYSEWIGWIILFIGVVRFLQLLAGTFINHIKR